MKKIITTLVAGSVLLSFAACSKTPNPKVAVNTTETPVTTEASVDETTTATEETSVSDTTNSTVPVSSETRLYPVYQSVEMLTPDASIYTFDPGFFEDVIYKMGLVDINGNFIYSDYSYVDYYEENDCYIVVNLGEFGITDCGLVSADGTKCTSLDFNGYYIDYDGTTYLTKYEKGNMIISCFDKDLNAVFENKEIKVNSNVASALYGHRGICVRGSFEDTTVIGSMDTNHDMFNCMIDNETGEMITNVERVYGELVINNTQTSTQVYDKDGNIVEDLKIYKRYVLFPKEGLILYNDYQAVAVDPDGNIVNTIGLKEGFYIDNTDNFIVMNNNYETNIYDMKLNHVMKCSDVRLKSGFVFELIDGDPESIIHASYEGGFFVNVVSGNKLITDIYESDFRILRNMGFIYVYGDVDLQGFYDKDLNKVDCPFNYGDETVDTVTGEVYLADYNPDTDVTTIYYAETGEVYCMLDGFLNDNFIISDGILSGVLGNYNAYSYGSNSLKYSVIVGSDGEIIERIIVENG